MLVSDRAGLTIQRNIGVNFLIDNAALDDKCIVVFFDDDFRPADNWLCEACAIFQDPKIVGLTGQVLADGAKRGIGNLSESDATSYIDGALPPLNHWAQGAIIRDVDSVYGCNMAFQGFVLKLYSFDEMLPLYAWQEDRDMTSLALRQGRVVFAPKCRGVHLGSKSSRVSGDQLGYSQVANLFYMQKKGTVKWPTLLRFILRAMLSNSFHAIVRRKTFDYLGRLSGNVRALSDVLRGLDHPQRACNRDFRI